jgi:hypothetical protein
MQPLEKYAVFPSHSVAAMRTKKAQNPKSSHHRLIPAVMLLSQ